MQKATNEQIIEAYKATGSVWKAAKLLGMGGQSVHERLQHLGYKCYAARWSAEETAELRRLAGEMTISEIARQLGRPYNGVALKISRLGIGTRHGNRVRTKLPRGKGHDKATTAKRIKEIEAGTDLVTTYARKHSLQPESLCQAIERHFPEWWDAYRLSHSDLPQRECPYCGRQFVPNLSKQLYCSRKCGTDSRKDASYFGGKRRETIGWGEGRCQICKRVPEKGLTPHHALGKENDDDNEFLVALCRGCHQVVTSLGNRGFTEEMFESLVSLVWIRNQGAAFSGELWVSVSIDYEAAESA